MLTSLKIEQIAIIEQAEIRFADGLNVLTGETGAGKSIIIDAINAVLGERASRDLLRTGSSSAKVTALFSAVGENIRTLLRDLGLEDAPDGEILLHRSLQADGRNLCRVNGEPVSVSMLKTLGRELINIHGQHDNQALLNAERHYQFLDDLADNTVLLAEYRTEFAKWQALRQEKAALRMDEAEKARKLDLLQYQIEELENAQLVPGERDSLTEKRNLFANSEKVQNALQEAFYILRGGEDEAGTQSVQNALEAAAELLEEAGSYYSPVEGIAEALRSMVYDLAEHTADLRDEVESFSFDPEEYAEIEQRLDDLYRLSRKYGADEDAMLTFLSDAITQRDAIVLSEERLAALDAEIGVVNQALVTLGKELHNARQAAAVLLSQRVTQELIFLDMPNVTFFADIAQTQPSENGMDAVEFLISANAGETPKPLAKIASGGELSRIMLAMKNVLAKQDAVGTLIFDEIDTGVSGRAAQKIALKLREAAQGRQVICVTHLAQIAAQASEHLYIQKEVVAEKTFTHVTALDRPGRIRELARITGGLEVTQLQLDSAEEMLAAAGN